MSEPQTIVELIAAGTPEAPALLADGRPTLSFAGLRAQVGRTVAELNGLGVGRGDAVAIVLPNGPAMVTAFLGVAAGATAAPLNPAYTAAEFDFYLGDLAAKALIVEAGGASPALDVARTRGIPLVELAEEGPAGVFALRGAASVPAARPGWAAADDVALVLHTSGTTSRPKMVPLSGGNLAASARAIGRTLALSPADRCLNVMPLFHIHGLVGALLAPLAAGGSVAVTEGFNALRFFGWLEAFAPTWYSAVPTMHQAVLARAERNRDVIAARPLRFIRSSSASLPPPVMAELEAVFSAPVIESYGMTEAAHQMASNPLPPRPRKPGTVGIAAGPEIAIMDAEGRLVPRGEKGEVVIRGPSVTRGYAANPEANAKAFSAGWFRTGDEGWLDADGYLTISGRIKEIINRGGEKIAPREIDEVLLSHAAVAQALAFALPHRTLGEEVAAAVVLREGAATTETELRAFARSRLASFKVPRRVVILDAIPKGPTGKLQRIGLAERLGLTGSARAGGTAAAPQASGLESELSGLWASILRVSEVAPESDFFELGGDSLAAEALVGEVDRVFGVALPLEVVYGEGNTPAGMAREIARRRGGAATSARPSLAGAAGGAVDVPATLAQRSFWVASRWNRSVALYSWAYALRMRGHFDEAALAESLRDLARRHETLRTTVRLVEGELRLRIVPEFDPPIERLPLVGATDPERDAAAHRAIEEEAARPFDLDGDPPWRPFLIALGPDDHVFGLTIHHLLVDGWGRQVLVRDLLALYDARATGTRATLPEPRVRFADFAVWSRRLEGEGRLASDVDHWRAALGDVELGMGLPHDRDEPEKSTFAAGVRGMHLRAGLASEVRSFARARQTTVFAVFLASVAVLLHRVTGRRDVCLGVVVANRGADPALADVAGCFINVLPLRIAVDPGMSAAALLAECHRSLAAGLAHQSAPFELVLRALGRRRGPAGGAALSVNVQQRNYPESWPRSAGGLTIEPFRLHPATHIGEVEFDLQETAAGFIVETIYRAELFTEEAIARLDDGLANGLAWIVRDTDRPVGDAPRPSWPVPRVAAARRAP